MHWQHLLALLGVCGSALGQSLLTVLEENGFTDFAQLLEGDPVLDAGPSLVVYAPSNAALADADETTAITRRATAADKRRAYNAMSAVDLSAPRPPRPPRPSRNRTRLIRDVMSGGSALVTLLDNPEFVNLGPERNQVVVEKSAGSGSLPHVFTGLGNSVQVAGADIPFDEGVIRPINGVLTLPENVSSTLPALGANRFLELAQQSGLLAELDSRASITVLAPSDSAFEGTVGLAGAELLELLKQHVLVDFPAYSPLLEDGLVYPTLAGGEVTVLVRDGIIYLNGARILKGDAITVNGLVHTVDKVLGAPSEPPVVVAAATTVMETLSWKAVACSFVGMAAAALHFGLV